MLRIAGPRSSHVQRLVVHISKGRRREFLFIDFWPNRRGQENEWQPNLWTWYSWEDCFWNIEVYCIVICLKRTKSKIIIIIIIIKTYRIVLGRIQLFMFGLSQWICTQFAWHLEVFSCGRNIHLNVSSDENKWDKNASKVARFTQLKLFKACSHFGLKGPLKPTVYRKQKQPSLNLIVSEVERQSGDT